MEKRKTALLILTAFLVPATGRAQDARSVLLRAGELEMERRAGVTSYVVTQTLMGQQVRQHYERIVLVDAAGNRFETFRLVSFGELQQRRAGPDSAAMTPQALETFANASEQVGDSMSAEIGAGLQKAGLPPGILSATTASPYASLDPRVMMRNQAVFLRAAAAAQSADHAGESKAEAARDAESKAAFASAARLVGTETVAGRKAFHLRADGLHEGGEDFTIQAVSLWIDTEHYVPLRTRIEGTARSDGQTRPLVIERIDSDYRTVPDTRMYEPYRQVMRMSGMMDARQEKDMEKARKQLAEFERRLAAMPADQRAMTERMMGSQIQTIRKLAAGGGFELETVVDEIRANVVR